VGNLGSMLHYPLSAQPAAPLHDLRWRKWNHTFIPMVMVWLWPFWHRF